MWIKDLSQETIEELCNALEKTPTMDWQMLMRKPFRAIYSPDLIKIARNSNSPAKALLDDLICRETTIQELVYALKEIGNRKAISIIEKGANKKFDIRDLRGQPRPSFITRQPEEHAMSRLCCTPPLQRMTPPLQRMEQAETFRSPVQESYTSAGRHSDPVYEVCMEMVSGLFSCLKGM